MQIEQSEFWPAQKRKHFSAFVVHFNTPLRFEMLCALRNGCSDGIAFGGQAALHRCLSFAGPFAEARVAGAGDRMLTCPRLVWQNPMHYLGCSD